MKKNVMILGFVKHIECQVDILNVLMLMEEGLVVATRIFAVKHKTKTEKEIEKLVGRGVSGLPVFEKQLGVLDFCWDMELIENPNEQQYFLMIAGCTSGIINYENEDLAEITKEQLNTILPTGKVLLFAGTHELVEEAGYKLDKRQGSFYEVRLVL